MSNWRKSSYSKAQHNCVEVGNWRKSSFSAGNGQCVEVGSWRKSTRCESGACVEVGSGPAVIGVRDTKLAESPVLAFGARAWERFLGDVKRAD